jgi:hypothetical protein
LMGALAHGAARSVVCTSAGVAALPQHQPPDAPPIRHSHSLQPSPEWPLGTPRTVGV